MPAHTTAPENAQPLPSCEAGPSRLAALRKAGATLNDARMPGRREKRTHFELELCSPEAQPK